MMEKLAQRLIHQAAKRPPDFVVKSQSGDYLRRWWLLPRNRLFNVYLHQIVGDDDDRALHDHPWLNISLILSGGYTEVLPTRQSQPPRADFEPGGTCRVSRKPGDLVFRLGRTRHRLEIDRGEAWTLFITGFNYRRWGFWCAKGWVFWQDFVDPTDPGRQGKGCA
ncbi:hypothetical protein [Sinimarinibacterium sp. NLF-5-8]|uniref:hypothetical protein n=1 Tax=Sinimarinibacterium sp. NLF-5-8 TaxID=2698684 RepID=UPI00137BFD02|nr:hypothetical protein [Sinimarinibacterium sp. NLF-5-8]QHS09154.1 hypothetical protein GT972_02605 [Sinimarinibacterium sp. NLF-5-8]